MAIEEFGWKQAFSADRLRSFEPPGGSQDDNSRKVLKSLPESLAKLKSTTVPVLDAAGYETLILRFS